jgi:hypothetical protein
MRISDNTSILKSLRSVLGGVSCVSCVWLELISCAVSHPELKVCGLVQKSRLLFFEAIEVLKVIKEPHAYNSY